MKTTILLSALAFGALTSAALAEPVALSNAQMDTVTAGQQEVNIAVSGPAIATALGGAGTGGAGGAGGLLGGGGPGGAGTGGPAGATATSGDATAGGGAPPEE